MIFTKSAPKSLGSNAVWNIMPVFWFTIVNFFLTPFIIRNIGTEDYGIYMILISVGGVLGIMNFGLGEATMRYVAYYYGRKDLDGINRAIGATLSVYSISSFGICAAMFILAPNLIGLFAIPTEKIQIGIFLIRVIAINFSFVSVNSVFISIARALQRYDWYAKITVSQSIFQTIGTVIIISLGYGLGELVLWVAITSLFTIFLSIVVARHLIPMIRLRPRLSKEGIKEVFGYGFFSMITQVMGTISSNADRLLLGSLVNPAAVAYLAVPVNVMTRANSAVVSAGSALFPRFSSMDDPAEMKRLFFNSMWFFLTGTIVIFVPVFVLLPDFLRLWLGKEFAIQSAWVGQIIAFLYIFRGAFIPHEFYFRGIGKPQYVSVLFFITGAGTLILNLILIPKFGLAGAGYGYCFYNLTGLGAIIFTCRRMFRMESLKPLVRIILLPLTIGLGGIIAGISVRNQFLDLGWLGLIAMGVIFVVVLGGSIMLAEYMSGRESPRIAFLLNMLRHLNPCSRALPDKASVLNKIPPVTEK